MPELPEVETVMRGLAAAVENARIQRVDQHRPDLRFPIPADFKDRLTGQKIIRLSRRAKYIVMYLDSGDVALVHLGMSGRMIIHDTLPKIAKHDHLVFHFENGKTVVFHDPRRFGFVDVLPAQNIKTCKYFCHLGPEPLSEDFNALSLQKKLNGKKTAIKLAIMDQRIVVGVGNIYACEALFRAHLHPTRASGEISLPDLEKLVVAIKAVLQDAIKAGGSSLRDHRQTNGELGYFQHDFLVYGREGDPSPADPQTPIQRIVQSGRSTFYCPASQI